MVYMPSRAAVVRSRFWRFLPLLLALAPAGCSTERAAEAPAASASPQGTTPTTTAAAVPVPVAPLPSPTKSPLPLTGYDVEGWTEAVAQIEEKRGSSETLKIPPELLHGSDKRVFLAAQLADATRTAVHTPHDLAAAARMLLSGELVEVPPLSEVHLLYDVGADVAVDPWSHYDVESGKESPLSPQSPEHDAIRSLASDFGGYTYDLSRRSDRSRFQARLLSTLRPEARAVLDEIARAYHARFGRRLPVSSLMRTLQYQRRLSRVNPNASKLEISPHTTGLAFDVLDKFMTNEEQNFVLQEVARLEQEGRVEALRERRNHIHVYVFENGQRPPDTLVATFFDEVEAAHPGSAPRTTVSRARPAPRAQVAARKTAPRKKATTPRSRRARKR